MKLSLTKKMIVNISTHLQVRNNIAKQVTLQGHHVYSTLKKRGNKRFYVVSTWNTRGVFVGQHLLMKQVL